MTVRVLEVQHELDWMSWDQVKNHPDRQEIIDKTAYRAISDALCKSDRLITKITEEPDTFGSRARFTYSIGVEDRAETASLMDQLAAARAEGMKMAADLVAEAAERYRGLEGHCAPVIADALRSAAATVRSAATPPRP
jgi:hypothetical protein